MSQEGPRKRDEQEKAEITAEDRNARGRTRVSAKRGHYVARIVLVPTFRRFLRSISPGAASTTSEDAREKSSVFLHYQANGIDASRRL